MDLLDFFDKPNPFFRGVMDQSALTKDRANTQHVLEQIAASQQKRSEDAQMLPGRLEKQRVENLFTQANTANTEQGTREKKFTNDVNDAYGVDRKAEALKADDMAKRFKSMQEFSGAISAMGPTLAQVPPQMRVPMLQKMAEAAGQKDNPLLQQIMENIDPKDIPTALSRAFEATNKQSKEYLKQLMMEEAHNTRSNNEIAGRKEVALIQAKSARELAAAKAAGDRSPKQFQELATRYLAQAQALEREGKTTEAAVYRAQATEAFNNAVEFSSAPHRSLIAGKTYGPPPTDGALNSANRGTSVAATSGLDKNNPIYNAIDDAVAKGDFEAFSAALTEAAKKDGKIIRPERVKELWTRFRGGN